MNRRQFMQLVAAALASSAVPALTQATEPVTKSLHDRTFDFANMTVAGFLRNAEATSRDYVVCDYPGGTKLKSCCTPSGKTYVSVARMLPVMVESNDPRHRAVVVSVFQHAFDPQHPDFWGYAPADKATQLSVEAALVACSLWRMRAEELDSLTPAERTNIQKWLASCTQVPERKTNHAWFSAINHAARLELSKRYAEFSGDEKWMLDDLAAMDAMYGDTAEGWCSDSPDQPIYDLYNFYVFPNFPLMWGRIAGEKHRQWNEKFRTHVARFLKTAPYFFAANGSHPLMGRSLIYRWAVLSPLVLAYQERLWPHSVGLLKRIVRKQLEFHQSLGRFDLEKGKLRETYSSEGTDAVREPYVDNGHPYWAMLGFAFLSLPKDDPFWSADEEHLPVEKDDFLLRFEGPKFLLAGCKRTGEVRWMQALNSAKRDNYRDKYSKLVYSSHFAYCASRDKDHVPPDQALVFREIASGKESTRAPNGVIEGRLLENGVETKWFTQLGEWRFEVVSRIVWDGESERHAHRIIAPQEALNKVLVREGSFAVTDEKLAQITPIEGYGSSDIETLEGVNLIHRSVKVKTLTGTLKSSPAMFFASLPRVLLLLLVLVPSLARAATFESLGQPCRSFNVLATRLVTDPKGKDWFVLSNTNETTGVELIFIDPKTNTGTTFRAPAGQGAWLLNQVSPDKLVVGTYYDGKLMIFDLNEMKFTKVIPFPGEEYFWNGAIGSDGRLYSGTYPGAKLGAIDLKTLTLEDCGAPAKPNLYCRNVSAMPDGRLLCNFVTEKPVTKIYDPKTKQWSDPPEQLKKVQRCVAWNEYLLSIGTWDGKDSTGPIAFDGKTLQPIDPPPFPIPPSGKFSVDGQMTSGDTLYLRDGSPLYRVKKGNSSAEKIFEQDLKSGAITAIDSQGNLLGIRGQDYLFVKAGEKKAELRPIPVEPGPRPMHFIRADDRGRIWGGPMFGQTLVSVDLATKKATNTRTVCNSGGEVYDVAFGGDGKVYAVSYVGGDVIVYDPDKSWDQLNDKNPRTLVHLTTRGYIRPTAGVRLKDGVLYSGWMASYGKYGGAIAITDRVTGKTDLLENPLGEQAITALDLDDKFLYAGTGLHGNGLPNKPGEKPQFGMIDRETRKVVFQQALGVGEVSRILCEPKTKQVITVAERTIRLFDPEKRQFVDVDLPPVNGHAIDASGDGTIWFASESTLVHYDLATKKSERFDTQQKFDHLTLDKSGTVFVSSGPDLFRMQP